MNINSAQGKNEIKKAQDSFIAKASMLSTVDFFMERFTDYAHDDNYKVSFKEYYDKFKIFLKDHEEEQDKQTKNEPGEAMRHIVDCGVLFLMTNPIFSVHEFVEAGAMPSKNEALKFLQELQEATSRGSQREKILPYAAVVGYCIIEYFNKEKDFVRAVEEKLATMHDIVAASILKAYIKHEKQPQEKALILCKQLEEMGITIDKDGKVNDPNGLLQQESKLQDKIWKMQSGKPEN